MEMTKALAALAALSQPTRLDAFRLLIGAAPKGLLAGEICKKLGVRPNTLSANLLVLLNAGLVTNRREGRAVRYLADMDGMRGLLAFLMEDCCGGHPDLCRPILAELACAE
ncbi:MAG: helix-turn-helix domain-containing protein [Pseudomonadota bacterium]